MKRIYVLLLTGMVFGVQSTEAQFMKKLKKAAKKELNKTLDGKEEEEAKTAAPTKPVSGMSNQNTPETTNPDEPASHTEEQEEMVNLYEITEPYVFMHNRNKVKAWPLYKKD